MILDLDNIYPLIVPATYHSTAWDLPHYKLPDSSFILTWVIFSSESTMSYLTQNEFQHLSKIRNNWQQKAFENLRQLVKDDENFFTQYRLSDDGQHILLLAFMHADGIGSSRILLSEELKKAFPSGYYLAFPDRSCGLVIRKDISTQELQEVKDLVKSIFGTATTPMSDQLYTPENFAVPYTWTQPINNDLSNLLVGEIYKLS